ncbi:hypothetical protein [Streptomyces sp. NPDC004721]
MRFFATLYYCGPRPEEAVAVRVKDVTLPVPGAEDQWGELLIHTATPEVGKQWTDTGEIHEERDLKGRVEGETRTVPGHPALTRILRQPVSLATYARCVEGQLPDLKRRLEGETRPDQRKALPLGRADKGAPGRTRTCGQALSLIFIPAAVSGGRVR